MGGGLDRWPESLCCTCDMPGVWDPSIGHGLLTWQVKCY